MIALGGPTLKLFNTLTTIGDKTGLNDSTGRAYTETSRTGVRGLTNGLVSMIALGGPTLKPVVICLISL